MLASLSGAVLATRQEQPQQQLLKACLHPGPRNHLAPRAYLLDIPPPGDMRVTSRTLAALSFSDVQKLRQYFVQNRRTINQGSTKNFSSALHANLEQV